jgi:hypothetical protein
VQTLYAYMDTERWQAVLRSGAELAADELTTDELTTDPDRQLDEANRVRLIVAVPNRWPKCKPVPTARWVQAVDRRDGVTLWDSSELRVCSPPRGDLIGAPPRG